MAISVDSKSDFHVTAVSAQPFIHNTYIAVLLRDFVLIDDDFRRGIITGTLPHQHGVFALNALTPVPEQGNDVMLLQHNEMGGRGRTRSFLNVLALI
jgi:hypothetical protein